MKLSLPSRFASLLLSIGILLGNEVNNLFSVALITIVEKALLDFVRLLEIHSCINSKSSTFGYLDEKPIDTSLMKFLGLYPPAMSWYLEFAFIFSTFSGPFTTNTLPP
ncbi:hypothetical protein B296_00047434 [Ensete ventricosum]|uniref:Uncharacterized protein n=1 Tax=Ensete ventricosum TaxID=4639 RepID=A0A426X1K7_ENSVE|nr:hypothetical protein B296_00047434 [Ensete ventricosum]